MLWPAGAQVTPPVGGLTKQVISVVDEFESPTAQQAREPTGRTVMQAASKESLGRWLHRAWDAVMGIADAMERSPLEEIYERIDLLEHEIAALKEESAAEGHAAIEEMAKYTTKTGLMLTNSPPA